MALPSLPLIVNSDNGALPSLQTSVYTYINDNTNQDILADDVRQSIFAVANGTYGYKTIWSGYVQIDNRDAGSGNSRGEWCIWQHYYDPNYFIPDGPDSYPVGRRYQVVDNGVGVPLGDYKAVTTTSASGGTGGTGLTFNVQVVSGGLYNLQPVNQGTGYFSRTKSIHDGGSGAEADEVVYLNLPNTGGRPIVRINLRNTLRVEAWNYDFSVRFANSWAYNKLYVTLLDGQNRFGKLRNVLPVWTDTLGYSAPLNKSLSRIDWPDTTVWQTSAAYDNPNSQAEFALAQQCSRNSSGNLIRGHLELKIPIV